MSMNISSITSNVAGLNQATNNQVNGQPPVQDGRPPRGPRGSGPGAEAMNSALASVGVSASNAAPGANSDVGAFMKDLFTALKAQSGESSAEEAKEGNRSNPTEEMKEGRGKGKMEADLKSLMSKVASGDSADPTVAALQQSFQTMVKNTGSDKSLGDFLQSFSGALQSSGSATGNIISTTA